MAVPREALALIEQFEGYHKLLPDGKAAPYLCPARIPTVGIGSTFYEDGRKVALSDAPITRDRAYELLAFELRQCEAAVDRLTTCRQPALSRAALVSFVYNAGAGAYRGSTLRRKVNAGNVAGAAREFFKWTMGGGVRLRGLERRRAAESAMYLKGHSGEIGDDAAAASTDGVVRAGWDHILVSLGPGRPDAAPAAAGAGDRGNGDAGAFDRRGAIGGRDRPPPLPDMGAGTGGA